MAVTIKWRIKGFEELRRSPQVVADLQARARRVAAAAGPGNEPSVIQGRSRARASVIATSSDARRRNARDNSLLRALDAGR